MSDLDDSVLHSGVDNEPKGMFDNEIKDEEVEKKIQDQNNLLKELTPKLEGIISMIDAEIRVLDSVDSFENATEMPVEDIRSELKFRATTKKYLNTLKIKFALALGETKK